MMKVHFIAIGGSAMHNLAIALHKKGYKVTGSDDEIFEPALSRLKNLGLLPDEIGWNQKNITEDLDAVILGMHAKADNPELAKAKELGLKIYSYPEYLYEQSRNKTRIVIGGSHGKTTITAMILHVMRDLGIDCDYMVGAQLEGFDVMVKLTEEAEYMVFEGDEYLTSAIDRRPKFHLYKPHVALISGIAWDHINVFPTFEMYKEQFRIFAEMIEDNGTLVYCALDENVNELAVSLKKNSITKIPYYEAEYEIKNGVTNAKWGNELIPLKIFGSHNMQNLAGASMVLQAIGVEADLFLRSISTFKGAAKRLELVAASATKSVFKDFAHSPSKLKATIEAVKKQFPNRVLVACMELHTYSSLNSDFLKQYEGTMDQADIAIVYYNKHALELKRLPYFDKSKVKDAFNRQTILVYNELDELTEMILSLPQKEMNLLMMSSGDFEGLKLEEFSNKVINQAV